MANLPHTRRPAALVVLALLAVGCNGSATHAAVSTAAPSVAQRAIGGPITLADGGEHLTVTPLAVIDPANVGSAYVQPRRGDRYVAVSLRLTNVGTGTYYDSPANGAALTAGNGVIYMPTFNPAGHALGTPRLRPHESRGGLLTFEIPTGVALQQFRLTLESGFGHTTGQWSIPQQAHPSATNLSAAGLGSSGSGIGRTLVISGTIGGAEVAVTPRAITRRPTQIRVALTAQNVGNVPASLSDLMAPGYGLRLTLVSARGVAITTRSIAMPAMNLFHEYAPYPGVATFTVPRRFTPATFEARLTQGWLQTGIWRLAHR